MANRVMKFVLRGKPLDTVYHETTIECFSSDIKAFLAKHLNEAVYVSMNKTTAIKMYKQIRGFYSLHARYNTTPYDSNLKKIIREFEINTFGKEYKCIAYIGPDVNAVNKAIDRTVIGAGRAAYTLDLRLLNGYIHKPEMKSEDCNG